MEFRLKNGLDVLSTVAILATCGFLIWNSQQTSRTQGPIERRIVKTGNSQVIGSPQARIGILEFTDFQCPFCKKFAREVLPNLRSEYLDKGLVRLFVKHFPLNTIHPLATDLAVAAECAAGQDAFEEFSEWAYESDTPAKLLIDRVPTQLSIDLHKFQECRETAGPKAVARDVAEARDLQLQGTPTLFLGTLLPSGDLKISRKINGFAPWSEVESVIQTLISELR